MEFLVRDSRPASVTCIDWTKLKCFRSGTARSCSKWRRKKSVAHLLTFNVVRLIILWSVIKGGGSNTTNFGNRDSYVSRHVVQSSAEQEKYRRRSENLSHSKIWATIASGSLRIVIETSSFIKIVAKRTWNRMMKPDEDPGLPSSHSTAQSQLLVLGGEWCAMYVMCIGGRRSTMFSNRKDKLNSQIQGASLLVCPKLWRPACLTCSSKMQAWIKRLKWVEFGHLKASLQQRGSEDIFPCSAQGVKQPQA